MINARKVAWFVIIFVGVGTLIGLLIPNDMILYSSIGIGLIVSGVVSQCQ